MDKCPSCNINAPYGEHELCEGCLNNMLLGGQSFTFVHESNGEKNVFGCGSCGEEFTESSKYWEHVTNCGNQKGWKNV